MSKFIIGDRVRILETGWDHPVGSIVVVVPVGYNDEQGLYVTDGKAEVFIVNCPEYSDEFELVVESTLVKETPVKETGVKPAAWAVTKGERVVGVSTTRHEAREFKTSLGGKKEGYTIRQLVAGKEVR